MRVRAHCPLAWPVPSTLAYPRVTHSLPGNRSMGRKTNVPILFCPAGDLNPGPLGCDPDCADQGATSSGLYTQPILVKIYLPLLNSRPRRKQPLQHKTLSQQRQLYCVLSCSVTVHSRPTHVWNMFSQQVTRSSLGHKWSLIINYIFIYLKLLLNLFLVSAGLIGDCEGRLVSVGHV